VEPVGGDGAVTPGYGWYAADPLPWRRPWKVASQVATLDQLSAGRAILTVGLGATTTDLPLTGEVTDLVGRAALLDEASISFGNCGPVRQAFTGATTTTNASGRPDRRGRPVQERIPIWVVGAWPRPKSMRRVLRCDGRRAAVRTGRARGHPDDALELRDWLTGREPVTSWT